MHYVYKVIRAITDRHVVPSFCTKVNGYTSHVFERVENRVLVAAATPYRKRKRNLSLNSDWRTGSHPRFTPTRTKTTPSLWCKPGKLWIERFLLLKHTMKLILKVSFCCNIFECNFFERFKVRACMLGYNWQILNLLLTPFYMAKVEYNYAFLAYSN